jgi:hypothetical protein
MKSDPIDPEVTLRYGAWSESATGLPVLLKVIFEGKLSELATCIDAKLRLGASEVKTVSEEAIQKEGKSREDLMREAR